MLREKRLELLDNGISDVLEQMENINNIGYVNLHSLLK
jgi:hypothetical protein